MEARPADPGEIAAMREEYRREAGCQIVHDSALPRGIADPWLIVSAGRAVGYAGVWNRYYPGRLMELWAVPEARSAAVSMLGAVAAASGATHMEAQTNMPAMLALLRSCASEIVEEKALFGAGRATALTRPGAVFRTARPDDGGPDGDWVIELDGAVVAGGGILYHYNPPYGDVYMEVLPDVRRTGIGSYLVQELARVCREAGKTPAARCDPGNLASIRTLERAGFVRCGSLLAGALS